MHENYGNIGLRIPFYSYIIKNLGFNILSIEYRGFSHSDYVIIDEEGIKKDANTIIKFLNDPVSYGYRHLNPFINKDMIFLLGKNLGGAVATYMVH